MRNFILNKSGISLTILLIFSLLVSVSNATATALPRAIPMWDGSVDLSKIDTEELAQIVENLESDTLANPTELTKVFITDFRSKINQFLANSKGRPLTSSYWGSVPYYISPKGASKSVTTSPQGVKRTTLCKPPKNNLVTCFYKEGAKGIWASSSFPSGVYSTTEDSLNDVLKSLSFVVNELDPNSAVYSYSADLIELSGELTSSTAESLFVNIKIESSDSSLKVSISPDLWNETSVADLNITSPQKLKFPKMPPRK
jgi:hypothetical protein